MLNADYRYLRLGLYLYLRGLFIEVEKMFKRSILIFILIYMALSAGAQNLTDTVTVYFRKESAILDTTYMENGKRIDAFLKRYKSIEGVSTNTNVRIETVGSSSPEGQFEFNKLVAGKRMERIARLLRKELGLTSDQIHSQVIDEDWSGLVRYIKEDPNVTSKERILAVLEQYGANESYDDETVAELLKIEYSRPYWYIYHNIYPKLRAAKIIVNIDLSEYFESSEDIIIDEELVLEDEVMEFATDTLPTIMDFVPRNKGNIVVKANAIGYAMGVANVAAEAYVAENWSINVPFYYSGLDYFKNTLKFRVCTIQPEVRYHIPSLDGLFVGGHLGLGWFNMALDGKYRIQDAGGKRPAIGGGLGLGYKMQFKKASNWGMEFSLGGGVYDVKYDLLYNEANGPYAQRGIHNTFIGIDNAAVSFTYTFKKGGRK